MDTLTAVAVSMLSVSRLKAALVYCALRQSRPDAGLDLLLEALKIPDAEARELADAARSAAADALADASALGIVAIPWFDPRYPALLACTSDMPPVLWGSGALEVLESPAVAIVGSRAATPYARQVARRLAAELAERGIVVVSGLARGVDSAAHEGCLEGGGATIAVLGSGVDRIYPAEHDQLSRRISAKGLLISELGPGAAPLPEHFPLRNRIISGISLGTVVVEASEKSGSLITAGCAMRQGRDVMAVPGSVLSGRNRGSHGLLKDGAKIVETADDILDELGWSAPSPGAVRSRKSLSDDPLLARMQAGESYGLDDLVEITGMAASKLLPRLMELQLLGQVDAPSAGRFVRVSSGFW
ncbi:MAG: DNA-processing protein DprA [Vicinamibacterales bacterium]